MCKHLMTFKLCLIWIIPNLTRLFYCLPEPGGGTRNHPYLLLCRNFIELKNYVPLLTSNPTHLSIFQMKKYAKSENLLKKSLELSKIFNFHNFWGISTWYTSKEFNFYIEFDSKLKYHILYQNIYKKIEFSIF